MAIEDDDKPRKKVTHEIGQDLSLLSVEELDRAHRADDFGDRAAAGGDDQKARVKGCGEQLFQDVRAERALTRRPGERERPIRRAPRGKRRDFANRTAVATGPCVRRDDIAVDRIATRPMADMANEP